MPVLTWLGEESRPAAWRKSGAQSKWGRHCCRPHSYRRVVNLLGEPRKMHLASGFLPPYDVRRAFHQCSHRHPASLASSLCIPEPKFLFASSAPRVELRPSICIAFDLKQSIRVQPFSPSIADQIGGHPMGLLRDLLKRSSLVLAEAFAALSLKVRVDNHHRVDRYKKFLKTAPCGSLLNLFSALSMFRSCAQKPSRASGATPTYPLLPRSLVDEGG